MHTSLIDIRVAQEMVKQHHYLHRKVHALARPFAYGIFTETEPADWLRTRTTLPPRQLYKELPKAVFIFGIPHFTKLKGVFGYPGLPTKWQVLMLYRVWVSNELRELQGRRYSLSQHLAPLFQRLELDYLRQWGIWDLGEPWRIELVISYSDEQQGHRGIIYKALNFTEVMRVRGTIGPSPGDSGRHSGKKNPTGRKKCWVLHLPVTRPLPAPIIQPQVA